MTVAVAVAVASVVAFGGVFDILVVITIVIVAFIAVVVVPGASSLLLSLVVVGGGGRGGGGGGPVEVLGMTMILATTVLIVTEWQGQQLHFAEVLEASVKLYSMHG